MRTAVFRHSGLANCEHGPAGSAMCVNASRTMSRLNACKSARCGCRPRERHPENARGAGDCQPLESGTSFGAASAVEITRKGCASVSVLLNPRRTQAGKAVPVDRTLPGQELFHRQRVSLAGFVQRQKPSAYRGNHFRLPADHPSTGRCRRQIGNCKWRPVWADHIFDTRTCSVGHCTLTLNMTTLTMNVARRL